jgi:hypothetical protein
MLDPDPTNELGRSLLDPGMETWLLANNYVYAHRAPDGILSISKRPMKEALVDFARSLLSHTPPSVPKRPRRASRQVVHS